MSNFSIYSGRISNILYKDRFTVSSTKIPASAAWFSKEGKILCALQHAYDEHRLLRRSGGHCIQQFFESNAILSQDFTKAYQWCWEKLPYIETDWEGAACGVFKESYPLYPKEPLLQLIK